MISPVSNNLQSLGETFIQPLKIYHIFFVKKIKDSTGLKKIAWLILNVATGIFAYPACVIAGIGATVLERARFILKSHKGTLEEEFASAKKALITDKQMLDQAFIDFKKGTSAKIFLTIAHSGTKFTASVIVPIDQALNREQIKDQIIKKTDSLFDSIKPNIQFSNHDTNFRIILFLKEEQNPTFSGPTFSRVTGAITINKGKSFNPFLNNSNQFTFTPTMQNYYCETILNIPFTPQIDAHGEFIN